MVLSVSTSALKLIFSWWGRSLIFRSITAKYTRPVPTKFMAKKYIHLCPFSVYRAKGLFLSCQNEAEGHLSTGWRYFLRQRIFSERKKALRFSSDERLKLNLRNRQSQFVSCEPNFGEWVVWKWKSGRFSEQRSIRRPDDCWLEKPKLHGNSVQILTCESGRVCKGWKDQLQSRSGNTEDH